MNSPTRLCLTLLLFSCTLVAEVSAHPPVSIVIDSKGHIYYSDLTHVWVINPDGTKEIAVANVHTHELWVGEGDIVYGEDVQNLSGDRVRHKVWARRPDGTLFDHIGWRAGYPEEYGDYGFALDQAGNSYILNKSERRIDVRRDGEVIRSISLHEHEGFIHWHTVTPQGLVYITIGSTLYKAEPGVSNLTPLASGLIERTSTFDFLHDRHALMGLWPGQNGEVYVSVYSGQVLKRVSADGEVTDYLRVKGKWSPVGGMQTEEGILLILEWSSSNEVRVRRILPDETEEIL